jgi:regulator of RNase E activity RraA
VEVADLKVRPGDLLHGDRHGVVSIPPSIASELPAAADRIAVLERSVLDVADSSHPSIEDLRRVVQQSVQQSSSGRRSR